MAGEPLHVVSATLGHANPAMTLRVYAHVQPTMPRAAAEALRRDVVAVVASAA
jgi:integrase